MSGQMGRQLRDGFVNGLTPRAEPQVALRWLTADRALTPIQEVLEKQAHPVTESHP